MDDEEKQKLIDDLPAVGTKRKEKE